VNVEGEETEGSRSKALLASLASRFGKALDTGLARRADAVAAISPLIVEHLEGHGVDAHYLPIPWTVAAPITPDEREKARHRLRLEPRDAVLLYAGNLDAYQGLEGLLRAFALVRGEREDARLLIATASDPTEVERALFNLGVQDSVRFTGLADEPDRRVAHAAADVACVPRGAPGGLPIKLLDALSRGLPTVLTRRASAGLSMHDAATVVADDDPEALAAAVLLLCSARESAGEQGRRGAAYVAEAHSAARYLEALDAVSAIALGAAR
jgi:glycosyltransferase involved in cell wall biosynthesis